MIDSLTQVDCDWLRLGHRADFLEQTLAEVALPVGVVHEKRVWFEVVHRLIGLVDRADINDAAILELLVVHVRVVELFLALLEATGEVPHGRGRDLLLHLGEVDFLFFFLFFLCHSRMLKTLNE